MPYKADFGPFAPEIYRMPMSYPFRDETGMTGEQAAARVISAMEVQVGAEEIAASSSNPSRVRVDSSFPHRVSSRR